MSNTDKDKLRRKTLRAFNAGDKQAYKRLSPEDNKRIINYSKNPSWWNHEHYRTRKRREHRDLLKSVSLENNEVEIIDHNKPKIYYW